MGLWWFFLFFLIDGIFKSFGRVLLSCPHLRPVPDQLTEWDLLFPSVKVAVTVSCASVWELPTTLLHPALDKATLAAAQPSLAVLVPSLVAELLRVMCAWDIAGLSEGKIIPGRAVSLWKKSGSDPTWKEMVQELWLCQNTESSEPVFLNKPRGLSVALGGLRSSPLSPSPKNSVCGNLSPGLEGAIALARIGTKAGEFAFSLHHFLIKCMPSIVTLYINSLNPCTNSKKLVTITVSPSPRELQTSPLPLTLTDCYPVPAPQLSSVQPSPLLTPVCFSSLCDPLLLQLHQWVPQ